jgi:hypothetical protein
MPMGIYRFSKDPGPNVISKMSGNANAFCGSR